MDEHTSEERLLFSNRELAWRIGQQCRQLSDLPDRAVMPLHDVMNSLITEFWDQGFSQTEIRSAFNAALGAMNRYAAGEEQRDSGIAAKSRS